MTPRGWLAVVLAVLGARLAAIGPRVPVGTGCPAALGLVALVAVVLALAAVTCWRLVAVVRADRARWTARRESYWPPPGAWSPAMAYVVTAPGMTP